MPKYYDITPTEFIHDYLGLTPFEFVRVKNLVYLINADQLLEGLYDDDTASIYGWYDVSTFSEDFGILQFPGLLSCLEWFWSCLDIECLEDGLGAHIPAWASWLKLREIFTSEYEYWYGNLLPYDFFGSYKLEIICEIAKDGAIFANEVVPLADEDTMIALEIEEDNDE